MTGQDMPPIARIHLSDATLRTMKGNLYRSPVFNGNNNLGQPSKLYQQVEWSL